MYGLGEDLLDIVGRNSGPDLQSALSGWCDDLRRVLRDDPKAIIGQKWGSLANKISDSFPDLTILQAYTNPVTSAPTHHEVQLTPCQPDITKLAHFCYQHFGCSPRVIHEKFQKHMWHGVAIQILVQVQNIIALVSILSLIMLFSSVVAKLYYSPRQSFG